MDNIIEVSVFTFYNKIETIVLDYPAGSNDNQHDYYSKYDYSIDVLTKIYNVLKTRDTVWAIQNLQSNNYGFKKLSNIIMNQRYNITVTKY